MKRQASIAFLGLLLLLAGCKENRFVHVNGTHFTIEGKPYYFLGTNFWYGLNLGASGKDGNRSRLVRELDRLNELGIKNLRIMGGSEGPDTEPYRMLPSLQKEPGKYNENVAEGLDFLLDEMKKRDMRAVVCLNNFWNWSGGMAQYLVWSKAADSIPYPPPHPGGSWSEYQKFASAFYSNKNAVTLFNQHIEYLIGRKNSLSRILYKDDPTIMAWELANEPRGVTNIADYKSWIEKTCGMIKGMDENHLVTVGSEGQTSSEFSGTDPEAAHAFKDVDYMTIHIWVQNWSIYDPQRADSTLPASISYANKYIDDHEEMARKLNKPLVLEEFGISRDANNHAPGSSTGIRDQYYSAIFQTIAKKIEQPGSVLAGVNFWAWAGEGRPTQPEGIWKAGDDFIGDPPHEPQGWYSVYDKDQSTIDVIKNYAAKINQPIASEE
jgi:mannan endo-1,4-beta-mannosidase